VRREREKDSGERAGKAYYQITCAALYSIPTGTRADHVRAKSLSRCAWYFTNIHRGQQETVERNVALFDTTFFFCFATGGGGALPKFL
jgi:hypothetical protein